MEESTITLIYFFLGFLVVMVFAINYFNEPEYHFIEEIQGNMDTDHSTLEPAIPKYLTDRFEYNLYLFAYVSVSEILFVILAVFLPDISSNGSDRPASNLIPTRQDIVMATLIITGIAPNLPYIKKILEKSKAYLHDKAQIPSKGRTIYRNLKNNSPDYTEEVIKNVLNELPYCQKNSQGECNRQDLTAEEFNHDFGTIGSRYAKLSYLLYKIRIWSKEPPFRGFIDHQKLRYNSIEASYDKLCSLKIRHEKKLLSEAENIQLISHLDVTLHRAYRLISCLMFLALKSDKAVRKALKELGYRFDEPQEFYVPWNKLVFMLLAIIGSIFIGGFAAMGIAMSGIISFDPGITTNRIFSWISYAVPFLIIPIILVLCTKRCLSMRSEVWPIVCENHKIQSLHERPWHIYTLLSLAGLIVGGLVLFAVSVVYNLGGEKQKDYGAMLCNSFVWSGVVMVTVAFLAYRLDSTGQKDRNIFMQISLNLCGAIAQGFLTVLAVYIGFAHTFLSGKFFNPLGLPDPDKGKIIVYCIIAFMMGFSLYFSTWYNFLKDKRVSKRHPCTKAVELILDNRRVEAQFEDLSSEGALIRCDDLQNYTKKYLTIISKSGKFITADIKNIKGNKSHVVFQDKATGDLLKDD